MAEKQDGGSSGRDLDSLAWQAGPGVDNAGAQRLDQVVEAAFCAEHLQGEHLLDLGIGTGRLSLTHAAPERYLTGVDSTAAMLDECRRLAGDTPVSLLLGDVLQPPVPNERFDTVFGFNILDDSPDWRRTLTQWSAKLRAGGRLLCNIDSAANFSLSGRASDNRRRLMDAADLVSIANQLGLTIVAVQAYQSFSHLADKPRMAAGIGGVHRWERLLSWLATDDRLLALGVFLEQQWFGRLGCGAGAKLMVALEKRTDHAANKAWLAREQALDALLLENSLDAASLAPYLAQPGAVLREQLATLLGTARNRVFLFRMVKPLLALPRIALADFIPQPVLTELSRWAQYETMDDTIVTLGQTWATGGEPTLQVLAAAINYPLAEVLLSEHFHRFPGYAA